MHQVLTLPSIVPIICTKGRLVNPIIMIILEKKFQSINIFVLLILCNRCLDTLKKEFIEDLSKKYGKKFLADDK